MMPMDHIATGHAYAAACTFWNDTETSAMIVSATSSRSSGDARPRLTERVGGIVLTRLVVQVRSRC
jgi:hypothetical protein